MPSLKLVNVEQAMINAHNGFSPCCGTKRPDRQLMMQHKHRLYRQKKRKKLSHSESLKGDPSSASFTDQIQHIEDYCNCKLCQTLVKIIHCWAHVRSAWESLLSTPPLVCGAFCPHNAINSWYNNNVCTGSRF